MNTEMNNSAPSGGAKREGQSERGGFGWFGEVAKILLPSLVTALIGFGIWSTQKDIEQTVEKNNRMIQMRLALSEEVFKRQLTVYEATCKEIATMQQALTQERNGKKAADSLESLHLFRQSNALYISDKVETSLSDLWEAGINVMMMQAEDEAVKKRVAERIATAHVHMKDELKVNELSKMVLGSGDQPK